MLLRRVVVGSVAVVLAWSGVALTGPASSASPSGAEDESARVLAGKETGLVRLKLPDQQMMDRLVASGADIAAQPSASPRDGDSRLVDVVVSGRELAALRADGAQVLQVIAREDEGTAHFLASKKRESRRESVGLAVPKSAQKAAGDEPGAAAAAVDTLQFLQAYWWTSRGQTFVQAEVATTAVYDPDVEIDVTWQTAGGATGTFPLQRFEDGGEYQYHIAQPQSIPDEPVRLSATSSLGGTATKAPRAWPGKQAPPTPEGYQEDFISAYMTPTDVRARIRRLARQYPDLVDVIDLPNRTTGYRRTAAAYVGDPATAAIVVESRRFGSQGMNGVQVKTVDPRRDRRSLRARYRDRVLTVDLATDAEGTVVSTTDEVAAFLSAKYPNRFDAFVENGSAGRIMPVVSPVRLDDGLSASGLSRPWTVQALRIGTHRDGSRPGVLAYSQEHAREWATPLVTLEFAERLLANATTDEETTQLLEDVDVFVLPTVNPDGANYSFNDYNFQRKNLVNHCTGADRDLVNRNRWGVDINRNYTVGSLFDGYVGASTSCLSSGYAGTGELSEPESGNVVALAEGHPNIRYALNVHSYGGYFMWPPGSYALPGRITLPRPDIEESANFLDAAKRIVTAISAHRGTVTWPSNTGPVADVLYSAAGNSADQLYYDYGIYAWDFEIGNDLWNPETSRWEGVGFQPPYAEAHEESQEYAGGLMELLRVAADSAS